MKPFDFRNGGRTILRQYKWAVIIGLFVLLIVLLAFLGPNYDVCEYTAEYAYKNCTPQNIDLIAARKLGELLSDSAFVTALATLAIAAFTFALWFATKGMLGATNETIKLARAEFISTHRPRLRIRNIVVDRPKTVDGRSLTLFHKGHVIKGQFYISNVGESRADIIDGHCLIFWNRGGLPMRRPYEGNGDDLQAAKRTLLSGESTPALFRSDKPVGDEGMTFGRPVIGGADLFVMGWVTYADRNNDIRRTSFCREYRMSDDNNKLLGPEGRFIPVDNSDYEHEE